ncbi:uncharacterized protein LOC123534306 [Mercenaria mercenaria]|uniref:uncharacterized protein LOC123534306 n=1 Tax=Mercenaria mercenaria TaxID=6596 RepID=UPI00234F35ED|nr:uncharacterized protein LOC123534306 [Mercenaria mercenaria]
MDQILRRVVIFLCWTFILFEVASCLTCGQTKCLDGEHCCSLNGGSNNCCCKKDATGSTSRCHSHSETPPNGNGFPGCNYTNSCLTCGQTKCSDGEHCCSLNGGSNNCCCKNDVTGSTSSCHSESETSTKSTNGNGFNRFPWWGAVIILVVIVCTE